MAPDLLLMEQVWYLLMHWDITPYLQQYVHVTSVMSRKVCSGKACIKAIDRIMFPAAAVIHQSPPVWFRYRTFCAAAVMKENHGEVMKAIKNTSLKKISHVSNAILFRNLLIF